MIIWMNNGCQFNLIRAVIPISRTDALCELDKRNEQRHFSS